MNSVGSRSQERFKGRFPEGKRFAFTVFDDTDFCTLDRVKPVYRLLEELGFRTTKSVWDLEDVPSADAGEVTLQDETYLKFILWLQKEGFEIGLHNVRSHDATRDVIERGLDEFRRLLGQYPRTHCSHASNRENIYGGPKGSLPLSSGLRITS